ncbi:MAG: polysaccharide deacetylase family protein [Magnetococcales bacterium]|nr:polysaccharide deacetylase family protein [Magnetococcales bacterium]
MIVRDEIRMPGALPPRLVVVVDTEEEFDWYQNFDRKAVDVTAIRHVRQAQQIFEAFKVKPTYVVDYPVAHEEESVDTLKAFSDAGTALIGAHLHPWVSPPHKEMISAANSFPGNLPRALESAKLITLTETIERAFGRRPVIYKAGRYGLGNNTPDILEELGYSVDLSAAPPFNYRVHSGPDFSNFSNHPYWCGSNKRIFGLPNTGAFVGVAGHFSPSLFHIASNPLISWTRMQGILSRLGIVSRLRLSPEGFTHAEHKSLTRALFRQGVRVFVLSFHSTSLKPGCTPYVHNEEALHHFLDTIRNYLDFFLGEFGGVASTPIEVRQEADKWRKEGPASRK